MQSMTKEFFFRKIVPAVKQLLGIADLSLFRKQWAKRIGKILYHRKYNAQEIVSIMKKLGMKEGSIVCIHSSMMQFYNYLGTAEELIDEILKTIGTDGTLIMPAFPPKPPVSYDEYLFDPKTAKTAAGFLAETFRRYKGVIRSNNVHHSVCAIGRHAKYLTEDHTKGRNCWDEYSPWYRMCQLDALIFNFGMPRSYIGTFHHCVEAMLYTEYPYWNQFFSYEQSYKYIDKLGQIQTYKHIEGDLIRKTREKKVTRYFDSKDWNIARISNLEIKVYYSKHALNKMLDLGRKGITVYYVPSTKGFHFNDYE